MRQCKDNPKSVTVALLPSVHKHVTAGQHVCIQKAWHLPILLKTCFVVATWVILGALTATHFYIPTIELLYLNSIIILYYLYTLFSQEQAPLEHIESWNMDLETPMRGYENYWLTTSPFGRCWLSAPSLDSCQVLSIHFRRGCLSTPVFIRFLSWSWTIVPIILPDPGSNLMLYPLAGDEMMLVLIWSSFAILCRCLWYW